MADEQDVDFGPAGYLPERAAQRARKIVLRAPLGLQWIVGSVVAGIAVAIAGVLFLRQGATPPEDPWVEVMAVDSVPASTYDLRFDVLIVGAGGRIRAFADADDIAWCASSNRLESPEGDVWSLTGRGYRGVASLHEHPTFVWRDRLFLDPTTTTPGPPPTDAVVHAEC
ncbi:MAG: hypothetical protein WD011_05410 [Nitriliruptoraceae bacterium]